MGHFLPFTGPPVLRVSWNYGEKEIVERHSGNYVLSSIQRAFLLTIARRIQY